MRLEPKQREIQPKLEHERNGASHEEILLRAIRDTLNKQGGSKLDSAVVRQLVREFCNATQYS